MASVFGWQGLSLQHPNDWAPVVLTGDRRSGYVRLASSRKLSLQVRWAPPGREEPDRALDRYLDRLARDARRKRQNFRSDRDGFRYRYQGEIDGEGILFSAEDGRIVFLEATGETTTARTRVVDRVRSTFRATGERWAVLGIDFALPFPLRLEAKEFVAGRTMLRLTGRGVRLTAERWGLAESLLARSSLAEWSANRMGRGWDFQHEGGGLRATKASVFGREEAIAIHQPDANQIMVLRVTARDEKWRPKWDWLN